MTEDREHTTLGSNIKRERFLRIGESRVNKILNSLENLGKCSNPRNYEYTDEEIRKIFREIERKVKEVKFQFQNKNEKRKKFKL